jgi:hypothetical protein
MLNGMDTGVHNSESQKKLSHNGMQCQKHTAAVRLADDW